MEAALADLRPSLHDRIAKLEKASSAEPRRGVARFVEWMGPALPQLVTGFLIFGVAYLAKDSVDLALRQQQVQLSYAKEMNEQLRSMADPAAAVTDLKRAALLIATFGEPSLLPLMNELNQGGNRALAAEHGLRALAFMHSGAVCESVPKIMSSPARPLGWEGQMRAAATLAAAGCADARALLIQQRQLVNEGGDALAPITSDVPSGRQRKAWLEGLDQSIAALSPRATP